ncbi:MAG: flagellar basal body rod protein FlgB [Deltaproteobacteria bacterium]|nr:flagellar basal body rod protein FlgB [Deltaproteobacteria bacterium]
MGNGLFDKTISLLGNTLDLRAARNKLLASNIANQETPGYRAVDINFEDELRKKQGNALSAPLARTNTAHLIPIRGTGASPAVVERPTDMESYDRNSVGIEGEMVKLSENSIMYNASAKMLKSKFNLLMTAIKEGGR